MSESLLINRRAALIRAARALIPDDSLVRWIEDVSESETGPFADNLVSNEDSYPRVANIIAQNVPKNSIYLGVGPDQNFTLIAHSQPQWAFILDFRRRNLLLHLVHQALFALSNNRIAYLERLTARRLKQPLVQPSPKTLAEAFLQEELNREFLNETIELVRKHLTPFGVLKESEWSSLSTIQAKLAGPGLNARFLALRMYPTLGQLIQTPDRLGKPAHFLSRDDLYESVRSLQSRQRVVPLVGDFAGPSALEKLAQRLKARKLAVGLLYISDVEFFLIRSGRFDAYLRNLFLLPWSPEALVVRTSTREIQHPGRVPPDSSTTIVLPARRLFEDWRNGRIRSVDDLFTHQRRT